MHPARNGKELLLKILSQIEDSFLFCSSFAWLEPKTKTQRKTSTKCFIFFRYFSVFVFMICSLNHWVNCYTSVLESIVIFLTAFFQPFSGLLEIDKVLLLLSNTCSGYRKAELSRKSPFSQRKKPLKSGVTWIKRLFWRWHFLLGGVFAVCWKARSSPWNWWHRCFLRVGGRPPPPSVNSAFNNCSQQFENKYTW